MLDLLVNMRTLWANNLSGSVANNLESWGCIVLDSACNWASLESSWVTWANNLAMLVSTEDFRVCIEDYCRHMMEMLVNMKEKLANIWAMLESSLAMWVNNEAMSGCNLDSLVNNLVFPAYNLESLENNSEMLVSSWVNWGCMRET